jgi:hypothetical protein
MWYGYQFYRAVPKIVRSVNGALPLGNLPWILKIDDIFINISIIIISAWHT